jgi:hypothetical protein
VQAGQGNGHGRFTGEIDYLCMYRLYARFLYAMIGISFYAPPKGVCLSRSSFDRSRAMSGGRSISKKTTVSLQRKLVLLISRSGKGPGQQGDQPIPGVLGSCKGGEELMEKFMATICFASISTLGHFLAYSEDVAACLVTPIAPEGEHLYLIGWVG